MKKNLSNLDRIIRLVLAIIVIVASILIGIQSALSIILLLIGLFALSTSAISFCPIYRLMKIQTLKEEMEE